MLRRCIVTVAGLQYEGLFASTGAAVLDAMDRYGDQAGISARRAT
ncbi:hypothetical protein [Paracidovorax wautersii]|uniref:Uncharacterized protein n=1 Tax=Paracidovorax wautersii TaxID=1177982 RepID=A0A1I2E6Q7_9BURK|nr:hypothetical protein [Paracidovorax wautersii]SFE88309.1 hypothetical protein SAMN04489711_106252 [Paracidovorax wautersii]